MLEQVEETGYAPERFVKALRPPDLEAHVLRLEALWARPSEDILKILGIMTALVPWLVRAEAPRLDQLLLEAIRQECPGNRWSAGLAEDILRELLERPTPLEVEGAVGALLHCTENRFLDDIPLGAYLLLLHWRAPGAAERLLARPCDAGTDCLQDLLDTEAIDPRLPPTLRATLEALVLKQRDK